MTLVLLVDDDPLVADVVVAALGADGYTVGVLTDGERAAEVVELKRPQLVVLDCAMPKVPGIEVLRRLRASDTYADVPVLMLTARAGPADQAIAMRSGATDYMAKPFRGDRLAATVQRMIAEHHDRKFMAASPRRASAWR